MTDVNVFIKNLEKLRANPAAIQRMVLDEVENFNNGNYRMPSPTNPAVYAIEMGVMLASIGMTQNEVLLRKAYPSLAQTEEDLYRHMSDVDYLNRFATPSRTVMRILIGKDELYQKAVEVPNSRVRKIVIPRHTEFRVSDFTFTMQYPIELRIMAHGGLQVVYDVSKPSPLDVLTTNVVEWTVINIEGTEYIRLDIPVQQMLIETQYAKLNNTSGFTQTYDFENHYYFCRAYMATLSGAWEEIKTTHSDQVFDINKPTVVLRVANNSLNVHIPPIYFTTGLIDRELRIDIYTTQGPVEMSLANYTINSFFATWRDIEGDDNGVYNAPLPTFASISVFSTSVVSGGKASMTFEELRERVINHTLGIQDPPITNIQLKSRLQDLGYNLVVDIENITNRIYQATRPLPQPEDLSTITGIGCRMGKFIRSMEDLLLLDTVADNNDRITLLPSTLYVSIDGVITPTEPGMVPYLQSLPKDALATNVNTSNYLYTPFHYVLDMSNNYFDVRPYYLDNPVIDSKVFVAENDTTMLAVSTASMDIERTAEGYRITVVTQSGETYKALPDSQLLAQLSYTPIGENNRAFLSGNLVGIDPDTDERVFEFLLTTNYDVNRNDQLILTSFKMIDAETERLFATNLLTTFDLVYGVSDYTTFGMGVSGLDQYLAPFLIDEAVENYVGVTQEQLLVRLGDSLEGLWSKSRSVISSIKYKTYDADVPYVYEKDIFEMDGLTNGIKITNVNGVLTYTVLHKAGDPVLDGLGQPTIKHLKGTIMLDQNGNPIIENPRTMLRELNILMLDGRYYFATDPTTVTYRDSVPQNLVDWLTADIVPMTKKLHENTEMYFYPQATIGNLNAVIDGGDLAVLSAEQTFECRVFLTKQAYNNTKLRASITATITSTLADALQQSVISMLDISSTLKTKLGTDVVGVEITGLGGERNVNTMTLNDDSQRPVIRKYLNVTTDGLLRVQDNINVNFAVHKPQ